VTIQRTNPLEHKLVQLLGLEKLRDARIHVNAFRPSLSLGHVVHCVRMTTWPVVGLEEMHLVVAVFVQQLDVDIFGS